MSTLNLYPWHTSRRTPERRTQHSELRDNNNQAHYRLIVEKNVEGELISIEAECKEMGHVWWTASSAKIIVRNEAEQRYNVEWLERTDLMEPENKVRSFGSQVLQHALAQPLFGKIGPQTLQELDSAISNIQAENQRAA